MALYTDRQIIDGSQRGTETVWLPPFLKIHYFVFRIKRKKEIHSGLELHKVE